ncbi:MAG: serine/threonine-protein kinase [Myxococcota bacterium]
MPPGGSGCARDRGDAATLQPETSATVTGVRMGCPDEFELLEFAGGALRGEARASVAAHLDGCPACFEVIAALGQSQSPAEQGDRAGRYVLGPILGAGAMGTVYAARDPVLDRTVAVKVLRADRPITESRRIRLLREAQSLARIDHRNVVSVYDAGEVRGNVYVAMELVAGASLAEHLQATPGGWRETVALFVAAGEGLAAAHDAGIVHRDFKPANVLVDATARVVVTDFGLAASDGELDRPGAVTPTLLAHTLSDSRARIGTPAYMAPEQFHGGATARSDQFAFCVALVEALVGRRPYRGTADHVDDEYRARVLAELPGPASLGRALRRGLSSAPAQRFESMGAMLAVLRRCRTVRRDRIVGAALGGLLIAASGAAWFQAQPPTECEAPLSGIWTAPRRAAVEAALHAPAQSRLAATSRRAQQHLDAFADDLGAAYDELCPAMPRNIEEAAPTLRSQWGCLQARRATFDVLVARFEHASEDQADKLRAAVDELAPVAACLDADMAARAAPQPNAAPLRASVEQIRLELELLRVRQDADEAGTVEAIEALVRRGDALGFEPLSAELHHRLGIARAFAGDLDGSVAELQRAYARGLRSGHQVVAAAAARGIMQVLRLQGRFEEARTWGHAAQPLHRLAWEEIELALGMAVLATTTRDLDEAETHFEDVFAKREACGACQGAPVSLDSMIASYYGEFLTAAERWSEARISLQRALELDRQRYGPAHAVVADTLVAVAGADIELGELDRAESALTEALAVADELQFAIPVGWAKRGELLALRGDHEAALASFATARRTGNTGAFAAVVRIDEARSLAQLGRTDEARGRCDTAVATLREHLGDEHPRTADATATCRAIGGADAG